MATPLENKEIRGVTARQVVWLIGAVVTVMTTYMSILIKQNATQSAIEKVQEGFIEMKAQRKEMDANLNARINKLETKQMEGEIRQLRFEIVMKEKGLMSIDEKP